MTTPSPKPVKAWALLSEHGRIETETVTNDKGIAERTVENWNYHGGSHVVIPVMITPIGENDD